MLGTRLSYLMQEDERRRQSSNFMALGKNRKAGIITKAD